MKSIFMPTAPHSFTRRRYGRRVSGVGTSFECTQTAVLTPIESPYAMTSFRQAHWSLSPSCHLRHPASMR